MDKRTSRKVNGGEVSWSYRKSMAEGSEELKSILTFITGGYPPGIPIQEEDERDEN